MKSKKICTLALTLIATLFAGRASAEIPKDELAKMQGTWTVVSASRNGKEIPEEDRKSLSVVIEGTTITIKTGKRDEPAVIVALDPTKKPATIELKPPTEDKTYLGIYKLAADTLELAYNKDGSVRPSDFSGGENVGILKLARQKADEAKPAEKTEEKTPEAKKE